MCAMALKHSEQLLRQIQMVINSIVRERQSMSIDNSDFDVLVGQLAAKPAADRLGHLQEILPLHHFTSPQVSPGHGWLPGCTWVWKFVWGNTICIQATIQGLPALACLARYSTRSLVSIIPLYVV